MASRVPSMGIGSSSVLGRSSLDQVADGEAAMRCLEPADAGLRAYVAIDGTVAGIVEYADALRPGVPTVFRDLDGMGVRRIMLLSGDHAENARTVAAAAGIAEVQGDLLPEDKVAVVRELVRQRRVRA